MAMARINRLISLFQDAFAQLGLQPAMRELEHMGTLVHRAMNPKTRVYHTSEHVFGMCEGMGPRQTLAILFHDVVYYQLDGGFPPGTQAHLATVLQEDGDSLRLQAWDPSDRALALSAALFDLHAGDALSVYGGLNEFLSAVVAARVLQPHLAPLDLIAVLACIEATVPFRVAVASGQTPSQRLAERVQALAQQATGLDGPALDDYSTRVCQEAVAVANRDVGGFAHADPSYFISSTWLLIEESNAPLKSVGIYSLGEYRAALMRMEGFLSNLQPAHIFSRYGDVPPSEEIQAMNARARTNMAFACDFLATKIATLAIVEALAWLSGGDCPISMLLGDINSADGQPERAEDYLPSPPDDAPVDPALRRVFAAGRAHASANDLTESPLTLYVYCVLGSARMSAVTRDAKAFFAGELAALDFLRRVGPAPVLEILQACARVSISRREALLQLQAQLQPASVGAGADHPAGR